VFAIRDIIYIGYEKTKNYNLYEKGSIIAFECRGSWRSRGGWKVGTAIR